MLVDDELATSILVVASFSFLAPRISPLGRSWMVDVPFYSHSIDQD